MNKFAMLLMISISTIIIVPVSTAEVGSIQGYNINDQNSNGIWDAGETEIPGWNITLISSSETITTNTNVSGFYKFEGLAAGTYIMSEDVQKGWLNTGEPVRIINLANGEISMNNNFTNIFVEPINALTPAQSITTPTTSNITQTIAASTEKVAAIPAWNVYIALAVILAVYFFVITKREEKK